MNQQIKPKILLVDDDTSVLVTLELLLKQAGYATLSCDSPEQALRMIQVTPVDLVIQDMNFSLQTSGDEGLTLLTEIKRIAPHVPVLLMTAWGSIALAVKGMKLGAQDFFTKPWHNAHVVQLVQTSLSLHGDSNQIGLSRQQIDAQGEFSNIVGEHPEMLKVLANIARIAKTNASVLILGESGTGKELIADAIHTNSRRGNHDMVKVNMGAIMPSLFESEMFGHVKGAFTDAKTDKKGYFASAHQSSIFLDEMGELGRSEQVKLLRVLQSQTYQAVGATHTETVDVRVISATNRELAEAVAQGDFREDLYYRLNLITLRLPPLRERRSDIPLLAHSLLRNLIESYGMQPISLAPSAIEWLSAQSWPGNIRQLKQTLERTLLLCGKSVLEQADFVMVQHNELNNSQHKLAVDGLTLDQVERYMIEHAMHAHQGNISRVAKALGLSRAALYRRLEKHGLGSEPQDAFGLSSGSGVNNPDLGA